LTTEFQGKIDLIGQSDENHIIVWYFRPGDITDNEAIKNSIKSTNQCILNTFFSCAEYLSYTLVDIQGKDDIDERNRMEDGFTLVLQIDRIPTYPLYVIAKTWWPFGPEVFNVMRWDRLSFSDVRNLLMLEIHI